MKVCRKCEIGNGHSPRTSSLLPEASQPRLNNCFARCGSVAVRSVAADVFDFIGTAHFVKASDMKRAVILPSVCVLSLRTGSTIAKPPPNKRPKHPPQQQQQAPPPPVGSRAPSAELGSFLTAHLDSILVPLDQPAGLPRNQVMQLRESFIERGTKVPANEKPAYEAENVCAALSQAMDEREKAIASLQGSASVHGPSDLGEHRKDNPTWRDLARERHEERNRKQQASQSDNFLTTQLKTNWSQRAVQLRQNVNQLYAREREAERGSQQQQTNAGPAVSGDTITLDKPVQVKVKYGSATIPAGTTLRVVNRDANGLVVDYAGENVTLPR